MIETIRKKTENRIKSYEKFKESVEKYLSNRGYTAYDLALLLAAKELQDFAKKDIRNLAKKGIILFSQKHIYGPHKVDKDISTLTKKGLLDWYKVKRLTKFTLSKKGAALIDDLNNRIKDEEIKENGGPEPTPEEKINEMLDNDLHEQVLNVLTHYPQKKSILLDFNEIEHTDLELAEAALSDPDAFLETFRKAIGEKNYVTEGGEFKPIIRITNLPEDLLLRVRDLTSGAISKLVVFDGIITSQGDILPQAQLARYYCNKCNEAHDEPQPTRFLIEPLFCKNCKRRKFHFVPEDSTWRDIQVMEIQEPPEILEGAMQPRGTELWFTEDICDSVEIGDYVRVIGILRILPSKNKGSVYKQFVEVLTLTKLGEDTTIFELSKEEEHEIKKLSKSGRVYDDIVGSIAPGIHGYIEVKEAMALQLFGGRKGKKNPDGMKERSDIHLLLVGDPGTAKSKMMDYASRIPFKAIRASGKGASGCGLTATVTKDEVNKEKWVVRAGAMVFASKGLLAVDEFDKMNKEDRSYMHDGMESQVIHVTKAGIIRPLKTETSILASANPKLGRFDEYEPLHSQFNLSPPLLSRFDLIFPIRDIVDIEQDRKIAQAIILSHSSREEGKGDTMPIPLLLLRKYIAYARENIHPFPNEAAKQALEDTYVSLRGHGDDESVKATPRMIAGLMRLSEASAKTRLSGEVTPMDVERAKRLLLFSLKGVATDPNTGKIDPDRIYADHSSEERRKYRAIQDILRQRCQESENDMVAIATVLEDASNQDISEKECRACINELKNKGTVASPKQNMLMLI